MPMIGLTPRALRRLVELERAEHVAVVGHRQRRHPEPDRLVEQLPDPGRTVEHGELGVHVQVDEAVRHDAAELLAVGSSAGRDGGGQAKQNLGQGSRVRLGEDRQPTTTKPVMSDRHSRSVSAAGPRTGIGSGHDEYRRWQEVGEAGWAWTLGHVRYDDEGRLPPVAVDDAGAGEPDKWPDGLHSGIAGLALALAEVRLTREWNDSEQRLATGIVAASGPFERLEASYFDGLAGDAIALRVLEPGAEDVAVRRISTSSRPTGGCRRRTRRREAGDRPGAGQRRC